MLVSKRIVYGMTNKEMMWWSIPIPLDGNKNKELQAVAPF
jgi:hypothetical protein